MKKLLALLLALVMVLTMFAACGDAPSDDDTKPVSNGNAASGEDEDDTKGTEPEETEPEETEPEETEPEDDEPAQSVTIEETVIFDQDGIKITVTGIEDGWMGPELKLLFENDTDKNIGFSADQFVINGITMSLFGYAEVAAGKKTNETIDIYTSDLETAGIDTIATISGMDAYVYDSDTYDTLHEFQFDVVTSAGEDYEQTIDESGDVLFEGDGVTVISKYLEESLTGETLVLLVKNETGGDINVQAENLSVNGYTIDCWMYDDVYADTVRFCALDLFATDLEENGIETIEEVTFTLTVTDPETYDTLLETEELKVVVEG